MNLKDQARALELLAAWVSDTERCLKETSALVGQSIPKLLEEWKEVAPISAKLYEDTKDFVTLEVSPNV